MNRIADHFLPHPEGEHRALLIHRPALTFYILLLSAFYLFINVYKVSAPGVLGFASNIYADKIVELTNSERQQNGLSALRLDPRLSAAAQQKAEDMFNDDYWAHIAPDGTTPWAFITSSGYRYVYAGENLAKDFQSSDDVIRAWMNSPSHRKNILNDKYQDIGVAVVNGELNGYETTLVVQMFGRTAAGVARSLDARAVPADIDAALPASTDAGVARSAEESAPKEGSPKESKRPEKTVVKVPVGAEQSFISAQTGSWAPAPKDVSTMKFDVFTLARTVTLFFGSIVLLLFLLDEYVAWRRGTLRLSGHALAHLSLLLLLLSVAIFVKPGAII
jgi:hypothetical protein